MSEEEDDYMSDIFINSASNVCPGVSKVRAVKREADIEIKKTEHLKKQRLQKAERLGLNRNEQLQKALERPIESNNKGFQLLAKMGYKPGESLGKTTSNSTATITTTTDASNEIEESNPVTVEPIKIQIKSDRGGFGRESAIKELHEKRQQLQAKRLREKIGEPFDTAKARQIFIDKAEKRLVHGLLKRCQVTCENVDANAGVDTPDMLWFWPERPKPDEEDTPVECDDDYTDAEKLDMLTNYLRTSYRLCFYCGIKYDNDEEMNESCPGLTRQDH